MQANRKHNTVFFCTQISSQRRQKERTVKGEKPDPGSYSELYPWAIRPHNLFKGAVDFQALPLFLFT